MSSADASITSPIANVVMNSLVSASKIVTNEAIVNPIVSSSVTNMVIPDKIPIPCIPVSMMTDPGHVDVVQEQEKPVEMEDDESVIKEEQMAIVEENEVGSADGEPMECQAVVALSKDGERSEDVVMADSSPSLEETHDINLKSAAVSIITQDDLSLICDLFYLPFEHGGKSLKILNEFYWLKMNTSLVSNNGGGMSHKNGKPEVFKLECESMFIV